MVRTTTKIESNGAGTIYQSGPSYVWVPYEADEPDDEVFRATTHGKTPDYEDTVAFAGNVGGRNRDVKQRAVLWSELQRRFNCKYDRENEKMLTRDATVPVKVAAAGNAAIAAYLAAHDRPTDRIANVLDVGERTVSQYITDFKKGER